MVESDDEFTELCSKLLKRVKKNKPPDGPNIPKTSTAARSRLRKPKASEAKEKTSNDACKETIPSIKAGQGSEKPSDSHEVERSSTVLSKGLTGKDGDKTESQVQAAQPLDQLSVKQLVLERMQQFKRTLPDRMKLNATEDYGAHESSEPLHTDGDLALALEMDIKEQPVTLEDQGLFFCQLCQKDLTAMSSVLREQHVNRCLDQDENVGSSSEAPGVPSCPLCGKPFNTQKSRASHLKRCAAKLEVPAQTLLQAVQRQEAEMEPTRGTRVKRKGVPKQKEPFKKRKTAATGAEVEDLLVAMALSRSMQEENAEPKPIIDRPLREIPPPEKKRRRKQKDKPTPVLLLQAPEEAAEKLQRRMSMLLSEEPGERTIITLPPSRFWNMELKEWETWSIRGGKTCVLWESSSILENRDILSYYTAELNPLITPWNPPSQKPMNLQQCDASSTLTARGSQSQDSNDKDLHPVTPGEDQSQPTDSQKALLDLAELAGEGMTLTQWNCGASSTSDRTGRESPAGIPSSGFIPLQAENENIRQSPAPVMAPLATLTSDFMELVNNPHLCDAQLQTDCGEVLSVHMIVLYARCPLLVEAVHTEGFWVQEASTGRIRRLLLNDVSVEAALCFLRFLYSASTAIPSHCLAHVCELARRFDVKSLIETCEQLVGDVHSEAQVTAEESRDNGGERAETFQELLKSVWFEEVEDPFTDQEAQGQEEEHLDDGGVGEGELEEIYEFAATQRRMAIEDDKEGASGSEHEVEHQDKESEVSSPEVKNHVIQASLMNNSTNKVSSAQGLVNSPFGKSPAHLNVNSCNSSPSFSPLASPPCLKTRRSPAGSASPAHGHSRLSVRSSCSARRLFTDDPVNRSQGSPVTAEEHTVPTVHTISLISPDRSDDAEGDMFADHSLPPLDDSYDRMFSETCGEYVEPSGIGDSRSHANPSSPPGQLPVLTSSPSVESRPVLHSPKIQPQADSFLENSSYSQAEHGKSPPSSFKDSQQKSSIIANTSAKALSPEQDIILILSSDEEPDCSTQTAKQNLKSDLSKAIKESPASFSVRKSSENLSHLEMSSCSETSWLVPATPLPSMTDSRVSHMQSSHFPWSLQTSLQTSHLPKSPEACLHTSSLPKSPKASIDSSHLTKSPKASIDSSHLTKSPKASIDSSHLAKSPKASIDSSHLAKSPKASIDSSHLAKSHKASLETSSLSKSPEASIQTTYLSKSPKAFIHSSHLARSPKASIQSSFLPQSPKASIQTSPLPQSPKASIQTTYLSKSPKASMKTSSLHQSPEASIKTSFLLQSPKTPKQSSPLPHSPQTSLQTSYLSHSPQTSQRTPSVHQSPKSPRVYNQIVSQTSFIDPSQTSPVSLKSPKIQVTLIESLCPNITENPKNHHEMRSSTASKELCSPHTSITNSTVFEVEDSEDEGPVTEPQANASDCSFQMDYDEPPIHIEDMWADMQETPTRAYSYLEKHKTPSPVYVSSTKPCEMQHSSPVQEGNTEPGTDIDSPHTTAVPNNQQSYLNSKLWDEWGDEDPELPAVLSLTQRLNKVPDVRQELRTPVSIVRRREVVPKVPITPLPHYSDMDTPVLKKELNRYGVRALPKKQMVLKLKEIFNYTHQLMSSDSEDDVPSSQLHRRIQSSVAQARKPPAPSKQRPGATAKAPSNPKKGKKATSVCAAQETDTGDDQPPTASQESTTSSVAASDTSSLSQSSNTNEFETAFADEDDDEPVAASQAASKEASTAEAVRKFIEARPELHKRILMYLPLDLAGLHAELKQSGIKMAAGKLLDFLDAQCVTFTTAAARKEKKSRGRRKAGKRY